MALAPTPVNRPVTTTPPRTAAVPAPRPSKLTGLAPQALAAAHRFFIYGVRKWGKSTWAADAPSPIFIDPTHATGHLHVARYPDPASGVWTWTDVLEVIDDLLVNQHEYQTLVFEDVGDLEQILWRHMFETVPASQGVKADNIESYGYGKGYKMANQFWRILSARVDELRLKKKMHIIFLGHSAITNQKNPGGNDYDTFQPTIYKEAAGILGADCDTIGFASFTDQTVGIGAGRGKEPKKYIGATGERVIHLGYDVAWPMVGTRLPLTGDVDVSIEAPFQPFRSALAQANMSPAMLRQKIDAELDRLGSPFVKSDGTTATVDGVKGAVTRAGDDFDTLSRYLTTLRQSQPMPAAEAAQ